MTQCLGTQNPSSKAILFSSNLGYTHALVNFFLYCLKKYNITSYFLPFHLFWVLQLFGTQNTFVTFVCIGYHLYSAIVMYNAAWITLFFQNVGVQMKMALNEDQM